MNSIVYLFAYTGFRVLNLTVLFHILNSCGRGLRIRSVIPIVPVGVVRVTN